MSTELLENHGLAEKRMIMKTNLAGLLTNQKLLIGRPNFLALILPIPVCFNLQTMATSDTGIVLKGSRMFAKRKNFHYLEALIHFNSQTKIHHQPLPLQCRSLQHHAPADWQTGNQEL